MSLIDSMMELFVLLEKKRTSDGEGGWITEWSDGIRFNAALTLDTTMQARIAQAQGVVNAYTITVNKGVELEYHDVIRREKDGQTFRITSDSTDKVSPAQSSLNIAQASAEKWRLT